MSVDDEDSEMVSAIDQTASRAASNTTSKPPSVSPENQEAHPIYSTPIPPHDLLHRIRGLYRLLDLIGEQGSGGIGK